MKIIYAILITLAVVSCSSERKAQYHVRKALKHGAKLTQESDTIRITTIDSFPVIQTRFNRLGKIHRVSRYGYKVQQCVCSEDKIPDTNRIQRTCEDTSN
jgi:hypothetical protein